MLNYPFSIRLAAKLHNNYQIAIKNPKIFAETLHFLDIC